MEELARFRRGRRSGPRRRREAALQAGVPFRPPSDFGFGGGAGLDCRLVGQSSLPSAVPQFPLIAPPSSIPSFACPCTPPPPFGGRPAGMSDEEDSDLGSILGDFGDWSDIGLSDGQVIDDFLEDLLEPGSFGAEPPVAGPSTLPRSAGPPSSGRRSAAVGHRHRFRRRG